MLRRIHTLGACALAALAVTACDSTQSPTDSSDPGAVSFDFGPDGGVAGEEFEVCKFGSDGTFTLDFALEQGQDPPILNVPQAPATFTVEEDECVVVARESGTGSTITVTEVSAESGFAFDHVDVTIGTENKFDGQGNTVNSSTTTFTDPTVTEPIGGTGSIYGFRGVLAEYYNVAVPTQGGEGCTPGYWKQEQHFDSYPSGVNPEDNIEAHFGELAGDVQLRTPESGSIEDLSLLEALQLRGGGVNALLRHAVAAWLNAGTVAYPLTQSEVVDALNAALTSGDYETTKDELAAGNELGCPLN